MCSSCLEGGLCRADTQFVGSKNFDIWRDSWRSLKSVGTYRPAFTIAQGIPGDKELVVGKLPDQEDEGENGLEDENLQWCAFRA
jgi:hypothetical protein